MSETFEFQPAEITDEWLQGRLQLHKRYEELCGLKDASRLGFLQGERGRLSEDDVVELWREAANSADRRRDAINHVYVHVPFCKSICNFCNYERLRPTHPDLLSSFVDRVLKSLYAVAPAVETMRWHTMYFGGGTPSVLPKKQLKRILVALDDTLQWHPKSTRFFEFDPAVMTRERIEVLAEHRFRHFSFGVQTLQASINEDHNRGAQGPELIARRFEDLRACGIHNISCDLLLGLKGTTPSQMVEEAGEILKLRPRWIDLFFLVPTKEYLDSHWDGQKEKFWAHLKPFHDEVPNLIRPMAHKLGYRVRRGHGHNIILFRQMEPHERGKNGEDGIFSYTQLVDQQRRPLHLLGLGTSARSLIFGQAQMECRDPEEIKDAVNQHNYFGNRIDLKDEVRLFLSHMMRDRHSIDLESFRGIFGIDITEAIPEAMAAWHKLGKVQSISSSELILEEEDRRERCRTLMWTVPDEIMDHEVERYEFNLRAQARKRDSDSRVRT